MRIALGADHAGFPLKEDLKAFLAEEGHEVQDHGTDSTEPVDYPAFCAAAARAVASGGADRAIVLDRIVPADRRVSRLITTDPGVAEAFFEAALEAGHEGVVVKDIAAGYQAGRRGSGWIKVKPRHTLDLVVLAVEWGSGRRTGMLSNIHLGARDPAHPGSFVMLGKTFKGMTDAMLAWQTERLLELETGREGIAVHVRPELVVEVAFDGIQRSSRYPGGLALRFARRWLPETVATPPLKWRHLLWLGLPLPLLLYAAGAEPDARYGLARFTASGLALQGLSEASDFDRDSYSWFTSQRDSAPFDAARAPGRAPSLSPVAHVTRVSCR